MVVASSILTNLDWSQHWPGYSWVHLKPSRIPVETCTDTMPFPGSLALFDRVRLKAILTKKHAERHIPSFLHDVVRSDRVDQTCQTDAMIEKALCPQNQVPLDEDLESIMHFAQTRQVPTYQHPEQFENSKDPSNKLDTDTSALKILSNKYTRKQRSKCMRTCLQTSKVSCLEVLSLNHSLHIMFNWKNS